MNSHQRRKLNRLKKLVEFKKKCQEKAFTQPTPAPPTEAFGLVVAFFKDGGKAALWFKTPNPSLGNVSPEQMVAMGNEDRLLTFIKNQLNVNK